MTILADFILLGHENVGSKSLGVSKMELFALALQTYVDSIAAVFNSYAIPRLLRLNGADPALAPKLTPGQIEQVDIASLGDYVQKLGAAGVPLFDADTANYLRRAGGMPELEGAEEVL